MGAKGIMGVTSSAIQRSSLGFLFLETPLRSLVTLGPLSNYEAFNSDLSDNEYFFTPSEIKPYQFEPKYSESEMPKEDDDSDTSMTDSDNAEDSSQHQTDQNSQEHK